MRELEKNEQVERSINKKFRNQIWSPFIAAVKRYQLISAGDKIAVCISGGKDSMLMAKPLQMLQRYSDVPFDLVFLVMDPGYNEINRRKIKDNAELLHICGFAKASAVPDIWKSPSHLGTPACYANAPETQYPGNPQQDIFYEASSACSLCS